MARDGFLPPALAKISSRGTPVRITMITAALVSIIAGVLPIDEIAALANAGTLIAFAEMCIRDSPGPSPTAEALSGRRDLAHSPVGECGEGSL